MNLSELCPQVIDIAKQAGAFIRQEAASFDRSKIEHKVLNDLLSYVDMQAVVLIVAGLKAVFPDSCFVT